MFATLRWLAVAKKTPFAAKCCSLPIKISTNGRFLARSMTSDRVTQIGHSGLRSESLITRFIATNEFQSSRRRKSTELDCAESLWWRDFCCRSSTHVEMQNQNRSENNSKNGRKRNENNTLFCVHRNFPAKPLNIFLITQSGHEKESPKINSFHNLA